MLRVLVLERPAVAFSDCTPHAVECHVVIGAFQVFYLAMQPFFNLSCPVEYIVEHVQLVLRFEREGDADRLKR